MNNINFNNLENKKTVCTIHHIDFQKFNTEEEKNFMKEIDILMLITQFQTKLLIV